ncbi:Uu.00g003630.m01.CDS01 [Anthostomella pinea]|uniref:Uu.00g003630.m01.CDS01 n=1 Tax=Anthostomella pinea TaxID=933095 RepID=A0AAI8VEG7_9PEZI|nr:Uu.00g003630.m01.CDS01 [Anthostomella pinea]
MPSLGTFTTTVHPFQSPTPHACSYEIGLANAKNALVFIGGLGDGPHTVPYPRAIAKRLEARPELSFSVFEFRLKSSFLGFGFARLVDDVADISALVEYLRSIGKEKVVLMGHSTGTQDCMEYTSPDHNAAPVDGYILQAPVCDRDALTEEMGEARLEESLKAARDLFAAGKGHERMPLEHLPASFAKTPISAWRWYALAAIDGEDNYFSPSLTDDVAGPYWQRVDKPIMILHSGNDEYVPKSVDKEGLVQHWRSLCRPGIASELSGITPGAGHRVEEPEAEKWLANTVVQFLQSIT